MNAIIDRKSKSNEKLFQNQMFLQLTNQTETLFIIECKFAFNVTSNSILISRIKLFLKTCLTLIFQAEGNFISISNSKQEIKFALR